jgi:PPOX class probable F420-dependent enzyme
MQRPSLTGSERAFLAAARRAVLATTAANGQARLVPICFVVAEHEDELGRTVIWSPLDEKPKSAADPRDLARIRDILARPAVTLLVDTWSEDWTRLGWLRCAGMARLVEPGELEPGAHQRIIEDLRAKHPQYRGHGLESRPLIRIEVERAFSWGSLEV